MKVRNQMFGRPADQIPRSCFVCNSRLDDKGLSLLKCQTAFSRISLGEKLQEVLGTSYLVLISFKDRLCWECASFLNGIDRFEHKIDLMKDYFLKKVHVKYKKVEVSLCENVVGKIDSTEPPEVPDDRRLTEDSGRHVHFEEKIDESGVPSLSCEYCSRSFPSLASLRAHSRRSHPAQSRQTCQVCGVGLASLAQLRAHFQLYHRLPSEPPPSSSYPSSQQSSLASPLLNSTEESKVLVCVSCGFTTPSTEVYCRHICNSLVVSLTCISCHKRYVDSNLQGRSVSAYKCQACRRRDGEDDEPRPGTEESMEPKEEEEMEMRDDLLGGVEEDGRYGGEEARSGGMGEETGGRGGQVTEDRPGAGGAEAEVRTGEATEGSREEDHMLFEDEDDPEEGQLEIADRASPQQGDMGVLDPEFFTASELDHGAEPFKGGKPNETAQFSFLRCEGCGDHFSLKELTQHPCFVRGDSVEYVELETPPLLSCKACSAQFSSTEQLRIHWGETNHPAQVGSPVTEINKIKDKDTKTETTFKVVKQNFEMRALIPGQKKETKVDNYRDMFVKVSDRKTDPIEDFIKRDENSCGTCGQCFPSTDVLQEHQRYDCLTCVTCQVRFYDNQILKKHYLYTGHASKLRISDETKSQQKPIKSQFGFNCNLCNKTFTSRFLLAKHLQVHYKGTERGACQFCLTEFDNKNDIQNHVLEAHGAQVYPCNLCDRSFSFEVYRDRHEAKHKNTKTVPKCEICTMKFVNKKSLLLHIDTYHRATACRLCSKIIDDPIALRRHERSHYFNKVLQCDICKKRFRSKTILFSHSKIHVDDIKFQCDLCPLGFLTEHSFKDHRLAHIKKGSRFKCTKCGACFDSRAHYWMHVKTHDPPHSCTVCRRSFRDSSLLAIHRRKHWRVRPYQCPQCRRVFSVTSTLLRHLYVHSRQYPHRCGICKKGFLTRHTYHRHTETVHAVSSSVQSSRRVHHQPRDIPSLPLNATDEDIFHAADTLIADDSIMFNDNEFQNKENEQSSSSDLITNEVVVETSELFDEILN